jgi:hypothetical protein
VRRLFGRNEITTICKAAITQEGPLDTRELAIRVMRAKGLDAGDAVMRSSIAPRMWRHLRSKRTGERWCRAEEEGRAGVGIAARAVPMNRKFHSSFGLRLSPQHVSMPLRA